MHKSPIFHLSLVLFMLYGIRVGAQHKDTKKQPVKKESRNDVSSPDQNDDNESEQKDTVQVDFGRNIVNLRTFNGYNKDSKGKWISSPNRIPYENPDYNNELYAKYKIGFENISQINIDEIYIDSVPYLAFIIEQDKGFYRDSEKTDFKYYTAADYFLIQKQDFLKLWNDSLKINHHYEANLRAWYSGLVGYKDIKLRQKYMRMEINKDLRNRKYTDTSVKIYLQFGMLPVQNKNGRFMRFYYGIEYAKLGDPIPHFDFGVFKRRYYEASLDLFHRFSRPKSISVIKKTVPKVEKKPQKKKEEPEENNSIID